MRCFIAIDTDRATRDALARLQERLRQEAQLRRTDAKWVSPENIHLTLKFLGEVADTDINDICRIVADTAADHERFTVGAVNIGSFGRPVRVVWVGIDDDAGRLVKLQHDLEQRLAQAGWPEEPKRFHGHLTLCRVKNTRAGRVLANVLNRHDPVDAGTIFVDSICVYRSDLTPQGPVYTLVSRSSMK